MLGIDARTSEKQQFFNPSQSTALDHIGLHNEVVIDKVCLVRVVGMNATDFGSGQIHVLGFVFGEKLMNLSLISQVEFAGGQKHQIVVPTPFQCSDKG